MFSLTASARGVGGGNFSEREFVESRLVQKFFFQFCWRLSRGSEFARYILLFFAFGFVFIRSRLQFVGYCGEGFWGRKFLSPSPGSNLRQHENLFRRNGGILAGSIFYCFGICKALRLILALG